MPLPRASSKAWTSRVLPRLLVLDMVEDGDGGGGGVLVRVGVGVGVAKAVVCSGKRHKSSSSNGDNKQEMTRTIELLVLGMHCLWGVCGVGQGGNEIDRMRGMMR